MTTYDHLVIGGGSGGYAAARTAVDFGLKTAVVDGSERLGGLCILRGCMPSKTVIESANRFRTIRRAKEFGLRAPDPSVIPGEIQERKRGLVDEFASYREEQLTSGKFDLIRGTAEFIDEHTLLVAPINGGAPYEVGFKTATIATGSKPRELPLPGLQEAGYWLSRDALEAESIPDHLIVFGGGAIALEAACQFEGLGAKVTVIQRSEHLLSGVDHDLADALEQAMKHAGVELYTGTHLQRVDVNEGGQKVVTFLHGGEKKQVIGDQILQGLGRVPNATHLMTDRIGLKHRGNAIWTDAKMATSCPHIFAAGDVTSPYEIVHIAVEQGEIAGQNAANFLGKTSAPEAREIDYRVKLFGIFSHPEVAYVGLSELEAEEQGIEIVTAKEFFNDHGKSMVIGETEGFVKIIADSRTKEILGASAVGPHAVDLIQEMVVAIHFRCSAGEFLKIPHYHPTLSEIWTYPAEEVEDMEIIEN